MGWVSMGQERLCFEHPDGFLVIKPRDCIEPVPLMCPLCSSAMLTSDDSDAHRREGCCALCLLTWVVPNRTEWDAGWRPSGVDVKGRLAQRRVVSLPKP